MDLRMRQHTETRQPTAVQDVLGEGADRKVAPCGEPEDSSQAEENRASILVHHGIHAGTFPVVGMTVAQARQVLATLINVDPDSIAVINGHVVQDENERVIRAEDELLSFVKKSSVRGAAVLAPR